MIPARPSLNNIRRHNKKQTSNRSLHAGLPDDDRGSLSDSDLGLDLDVLVVEGGVVARAGYDGYPQVETQFSEFDPTLPFAHLDICEAHAEIVGRRVGSLGSEAG